MSYDTFQAEIDYHTARGTVINVVEVSDHRWLEDSYGNHLDTLVYCDRAAFNLMKRMQIAVEFFPDRVAAMAYGGTTDVSVYYVNKGHLSDYEVCNLAILYAATQKLKEGVK